MSHDDILVGSCWEIQILGDIILPILPENILQGVSEVANVANPHASCSTVLTASRIEMGCSWFPPPEKDLLK